MKTKAFLLILFSLTFLFNNHAQSVNQQTLTESMRIDSLKAEIKILKESHKNLESRVRHLKNDYEKMGVLSLLFGAFCALWAQNTKRNAWAWFFLGAIFNVITVLILLKLNSDDPNRRHFYI